MNATSSIKSVSITAVVTRADGRVENLGEISYWNRNPLLRLLGRIWREIKWT